MHRAPGHCPPGSVCHLGWAAVQAAVNRRKFGTTVRSSSLPSTQVLLVTRSSRDLRQKGSEDSLSPRIFVTDPAGLLQVNRASVARITADSGQRARYVVVWRQGRGQIHALEPDRGEGVPCHEGKVL